MTIQTYFRNLWRAVLGKEGFQDESVPVINPELQKGEEQKQLSKEFVRRWLIENGFQGKEGQVIPEMSDAWTNEISERYIELFEKVAGEKFIKHASNDIAKRIEQNVTSALKSL